MAYLALYRKWRPTVFTEVIGQKHIAIPLERALSEGRLAHAYLFSGPRGTGKTSMARILAKAGWGKSMQSLSELPGYQQRGKPRCL